MRQRSSDRAKPGALRELLDALVGVSAGLPLVGLRRGAVETGPPRAAAVLGGRIGGRGRLVASGSVSKLAKFAIFANFWRARSRLYQNEILQENMRLAAFFKLYKICILLHRCDLKIFAKNRFEKTAIFVKFQQKNCNLMSKNLQNLSNFKNFSLRIW